MSRRLQQPGSRSRGPSASRARGFHRLELEALEDRSLPSTLVYASADRDRPILDLSTVLSTVQVDDSFTIGDVNVQLDIDHTFDADLDVVLSGPDGTRVRLFSDAGGEGDHYTSTILDDEATSLISSGTAPFTGRFRPAELLGAFINKNALGTWQLQITDDERADAGILRGWSLSLVPAFVHVSSDVPRRIPTSGTAGTIISTVLVADAFTVQDVNVRLDLAHTFDADLDVTLIDPSGREVELFTDVGNSGDDFSATLLNDEADRSIALSSAPFRGSFRPEGMLSAFDGQPAQGTWQLRIDDDATGDFGQLLGWSLIFERTFSTLPDLVGSTLFVAEEAVNWGAAVQVRYTLANRGEQDAGPFQVEVRLSPDATLEGVDVRLETLSFPGLAAETTTSGTVTVTLPGSPGAPPPGFTDPDEVFLGLVVDPANAVVEQFEANNANRGNGIDRSLLVIARGTELEPNDDRERANVTYTDTEVRGSIGVSGDRDWFVFDVGVGGYLTAEVAPRGGSAVDGRLELHNTDSLLLFGDLRIGGGGLLVGSDDRANGDSRPLIAQYVLPGRYYLAVSASATGPADRGDYMLTTRLVPDPNNPFDPDTKLLSRLQVGQGPRALVMADFNRDGIHDLATANLGSGDVSVLLGVGDGTFQPQVRYFLGGQPEGIVAADFNRDGRLDLLVLDRSAGRVAVLLGVGEGSLILQEERLDHGDPRVSGLLRDFVPIPARGTVRVPLDVAADVVVRDLNVLLHIEHTHDADLDVFLISPAGRRVELFTDVGSSGDNFKNLVLDDQAGTSIVSGRAPFDNDVLRPEKPLSEFNKENARGTWVLEITDDADNGVGRLLNWSLNVNDDLFHTSFPTTLVLGDFNRDGNHDRAQIDSRSGNPPFDDRLFLSVGAPFDTGAQIDTRQSNYADLLALFGFPEQVGVELFLNEDLQIMADRNASNPPRATPMLGDLTGDGIDDVLVLSRSGNILVRPGLADRPGTFGAPVKVNEDPVLPRAREVAIVSTGRNARVAALDLRRDTLAIYTFDGQRWQRTADLPTGFVPTRLAAGDLDRDGRPDLVVGNALLGSVSLYRGTDQGFDALPQLKTGITVGDVRLQDLDGDGRLDLLLADVGSSTVSVLHNQTPSPGPFTFGPELRYRAGANSVYGVVEAVSDTANTAVRDVLDDAAVDALLAFAGITDPSQIAAIKERIASTDAFPPQYFLYALHETRQAIAADFTGDGLDDLVAVNYISDTFSLLKGKEGGGFVDPRPFASGPRPVAVQAGRLNDDAFLDLVVLREGTAAVGIYLGDGTGGFTERLSPDSRGQLRAPAAGNAPTGLTLADVTRPEGGAPDGLLDILVGNEFGDLLVLAGNGDGTFRPFVRADQRVPFATTDLDGDGAIDVVLGDQARDLGSAQLRTGMTFTPGTFQRDGSNGLIGPGDVKAADLDGRFGDDLIFANTGSNNVVVYLREPDGNSFRATPQTFFTGTAPTALHVRDLDGDGRLDLAVANQGSNDVSVLLGSQDAAGNWAFRYGPRLETAGTGPNRVTSQDTNGDGLLDLLVVNGQDGTMATLPGTDSDGDGFGDGFFDDTNATLRRIAPGPVGATAILDDGRVFAATLAGIVGVSDPQTQAFFVADLGRPVVAFQPIVLQGRLALVTANRDGSASLLTSSNGLSFQENNSTDPAPGRVPSDLAIPEVTGDTFEVYFTYQGEIQPVVLVLGLKDDLTPVDESGPGAVTPGTQIPPDEPPDEGPPVPFEETAVDLVIRDLAPLGELSDDQTIPAFGEALLAEFNGPVQNGGGDEVEEAEEDEPDQAPPTLQQFVAGVYEALERVDWDAEPLAQGVSELGLGESWRAWLAWLTHLVRELTSTTGAEQADTLLVAPSVLLLRGEVALPGSDLPEVARAIVLEGAELYVEDRDFEAVRWAINAGCASETAAVFGFALILAWSGTLRRRRNGKAPGLTLQSPSSCSSYWDAALSAARSERDRATGSPR